MATGDRKDPYRSYNFLVEIDGITRAGFRECSGLDTSQTPIEYREGDERQLTTRKLPGLVSFPNITLSRGITDDADLRIATSLLDYIFRRLAVDYLPFDERAELGILTTGERMQPTLPGIEEETTPSTRLVEPPALPEPVRDQVVDVRLPGAPDAKDSPYCYQCGNAMQRAGSCYVCTSCGTTSGCS